MKEREVSGVLPVFRCHLKRSFAVRSRTGGGRPLRGAPPPVYAPLSALTASRAVGRDEYWCAGAFAPVCCRISHASGAAAAQTRFPQALQWTGVVTLLRPMAHRLTGTLTSRRSWLVACCFHDWLPHGHLLHAHYWAMRQPSRCIMGSDNMFSWFTWVVSCRPVLNISPAHLLSGSFCCSDSPQNTLRNNQI